jgi:hypothetical protein
MKPLRDIFDCRFAADPLSRPTAFEFHQSTFNIQNSQFHADDERRSA